eukprot:302939_1
MTTIHHMFRRFCQFRNDTKKIAGINNSKRYGNNWRGYRSIYPIALTATVVVTETATLDEQYSDLKENLESLKMANKITEEAMFELEKKQAEIQKLNKIVAELESKVHMLGADKQYTFQGLGGDVEIENDGRKIVMKNGVATSTDEYQAGSHIFEIKWTGSRRKYSENTIGITSLDGTTKYYCTYEWGGNDSYLKTMERFKFDDHSMKAKWWRSGHNVIMILDFSRRRLTYIIQGQSFTIDDITPGSYLVYVGVSKNTGSVTFEIL